jgi:hypothetical protein
LLNLGRTISVRPSVARISVFSAPSAPAWLSI